MITILFLQSLFQKHRLHFYCSVILKNFKIICINLFCRMHYIKLVLENGVTVGNVQREIIPLTFIVIR